MSLSEEIFESGETVLTLASMKAGLKNLGHKKWRRENHVTNCYRVYELRMCTYDGPECSVCLLYIHSIYYRKIILKGNSQVSTHR